MAELDPCLAGLRLCRPIKTRKVAAMRRRVVLAVLAAAFLVPLGRVRAAAQPGAALDQPGERRILQRQKPIVAMKDVPGAIRWAARLNVFGPGLPASANPATAKPSRPSTQAPSTVER